MRQTEPGVSFKWETYFTYLLYYTHEHVAGLDGLSGVMNELRHK